MSNIPSNMRQDPSPPARFRPSAATPADPITVPLGTDMTQWLPEAGFPDFAEAGRAYAAGQRAQARATENRAALTTGSGDDSTPTMYPSAFGQESDSSPYNDPGTPPTVGTSTPVPPPPAKKKKKKGAATRAQLAKAWHPTRDPL